MNKSIGLLRHLETTTGMCKDACLGEGSWLFYRVEKEALITVDLTNRFSCY
jgi:hypothetical protein